MKALPLATVAVAALLAVTASANAGVVITSIEDGLAYAPSFVPATTLTFDAVTPVGFTFAGTGAVVTGSKAGYYMAPAGDTSNYLSTNVKGGKGSETIMFGTTETRLGLYWGSVDKFNTLTFLLDGVTVGTFTGSQITSTFDKNGNSGVSAYVNFSGKFDEIVLTTSQPAFEVDNIAVSAVPEPATWALMLVGFAGLGFAAYRQTKRSETLVLA